jgi:hypothetical protein
MKAVCRTCIFCFVCYKLKSNLLLWTGCWCWWQQPSELFGCFSLTMCANRCRLSKSWNLAAFEWDLSFVACEFGILEFYWVLEVSEFLQCENFSLTFFYSLNIWGRNFFAVWKFKVESFTVWNYGKKKLKILHC